MAYMLGTQVWVDTFELLDSGIINLFKNEFKIVVTDLTFHFKFSEDKKKSVGGILITPDTQNNKDIFIELYNFANPLVQGYFDPIEVGYINERRLYINFSLLVADVKTNSRTFAYNIYLEEKANA
jgi:hypothetical protein